MTASSICRPFGRLQSNGTRTRAHCNRTPQFRQTTLTGAVRAGALAARASGPAAPASTSNMREIPVTEPTRNANLARRRMHLKPRRELTPAFTGGNAATKAGRSENGLRCASGGCSSAVVGEVVDDLVLERVAG